MAAPAPAAEPSTSAPPADLDAQLHSAAAAGDAAAVGRLLAAGADPCLPAAEGATPLMKAAEAGSAECIALLLEAGAPWNALDEDGYCAGDYATASKNRGAIELLMDWAVRCEQLLGAMER